MPKKIIILLFFAFLFSGCQIASKTQELPPPQIETPIPESPEETEKLLNISEDQKMIAILNTSLGQIKIELFTDKAPKTVANFVGLAEGTKDWADPKTGEKQTSKSLYGGTIFHRVIPDFMIQGGDPLGQGIGGPGYKFDDEIDSSLAFDGPGYLAMANSGPNTNGSQFFITTVPTPWLNGKHTIFGKVVEGQDVVKKIESVETGADDKPVKPVTLDSVSIERE